ncbi:MAG: hypothetical protein H6733_05580 [Alphaproteobacteria bacterium]|nr:hypothetical protein [Alphaproteobacteria bacterium]
MTPHPDTALLQAFVDGTLGEHTAVHVALHLDDCPLCANQVLQLDPLSQAFASVDDPVVPAALVGDVLAAAATPLAPVPWIELVVGTVLLAAAAASTMAAGGLVGWWSRARTLIEVLTSVTADVLAQPSVSVSLATSAVVLGAATLMLVRATGTSAQEAV